MHKSIITGALLLAVGFVSATTLEVSAFDRVHELLFDSVVNKLTSKDDDELTLERQSTPVKVVDEHLRALNACDLERLMAQYPNTAEIHLPDGVVVKGRTQLRALFVDFVKAREQGGLCGLTFTPEHVSQVGKTINVQWRSEAPFLSEPYRGSDAYVTWDGLMYAQVTTFKGEDLKFRP
ncbi:nuclear transport factor 2 family protein [Scytonema sp. NUACC26]|uniref:nuclear transport factor 2 family protein n=1 Tax=Scytonema sp. NUACC26 TaxID=3140176 RepID=UPI0034DC366E